MVLDWNDHPNLYLSVPLSRCQCTKALLFQPLKNTLRRSPSAPSKIKYLDRYDGSAPQRNAPGKLRRTALLIVGSAALLALLIFCAVQKRHKLRAGFDPERTWMIGDSPPNDIAAIANSGNDVLVFVHGSSNAFEDAIIRGAYNKAWLAMASDHGLKSDFDVVVFSWPSFSYPYWFLLADFIDYKNDQKQAAASAAHFGQFLTLMSTLALIVATVVLYVVVPKGFFPEQDTGFVFGQAEARQDISFEGMSKITNQFAEIIGQGIIPALSVDFYTKFLGDGYYLSILWRTVRISLGTTVIAAAPRSD